MTSSHTFLKEADMIRKINPMLKRHRHNNPLVIEELLQCIERIDNKTAGFTIVLWDDTGRSTVSVKAGGAIHYDAVAQHASNMILTLLAVDRLNGS